MMNLPAPSPFPPIKSPFPPRMPQRRSVTRVSLRRSMWIRQVGANNNGALPLPSDREFLRASREASRSSGLTARGQTRRGGTVPYNKKKIIINLRPKYISYNNNISMETSQTEREIPRVAGVFPLASLSGATPPHPRPLRQLLVPLAAHIRSTLVTQPAKASAPHFHSCLCHVSFIHLPLMRS